MMQKTATVEDDVGMSTEKAYRPQRSTRSRLRKIHSRLSRIVIYFLIIIVTAIILLPIYYMVVTSLKTNTELLLFPPKLYPASFQAKNYLQLFIQMPFAAFYKNSLIVSILVMVGSVLSSGFVAFGLSRYRSRFKNAMFMIIISTLLLPAPALMIPQFLLFRYLGWINTFLPLIVPSFFGSAYNIFFLRQYLSTLPNDYFEAARIDGCGEIRTWWKLAMPLCTPALATLAMFQFLWSWNDLLTPVIYINSESLFTLPIGMASLVSAFRLIPWNLIMAGNILTVLPIIIIFFCAQKYLVEGITITGIK